MMEASEEVSLDDYSETAAPKKKRGLMSRLSLRRKSKTKEPSKRDDSPTPLLESEQTVAKSTTRDGVPVITSENPENFPPSSVKQTEEAPTTEEPPSKSTTSAGKSLMKKSTRKGTRRVVLDKPPAAADAAFSGPPRYDWIDIETAAAVKVQAAYRRNKVMAQLEKEGKSTSAMRNKIRRRNAKQHVTTSEDTPGLFQCCGAGLIFGDATEEDQAAIKQYERDQFEEKKRQRQAEDERLRRTFRSRKKKASNNLVEGVEVVDDL